MYMYVPSVGNRGTSLGYSVFHTWVYTCTSVSLQLNAEAIDRCEPLSAFFTIARMQLEGLQEPSSTSTLAEKLGKFRQTHTHTHIHCTIHS